MSFGAEQQSNPIPASEGGPVTERMIPHHPGFIGLDPGCFV
jgi:hypothetical protein